MKDSEYQAMTTNEKLVVSGLIDEWDRAIKARDRDKAVSILKRVFVSSAEAEEIVFKVLENPSKYGY